MTLHGMFGRRDPAVPYDLSNVEQGDSVVVGFPHGVSFEAIVLQEPWDFHVAVIDRFGVRMTVPASMVLSHTARGEWMEGRAAA